ncbi:MAG: hypothetical protein JWP75_1284 [Frondihabitans sp.]|nr:hypothetical protein [Frondihabitans sp.]
MNGASGGGGAVIALSQAQVRSSLNHLRGRSGGFRRLWLVAAGVLAASIVLDVVTYRSLSTLLAPAFEDKEARRVVLPLLPALFAVPSFGLTLVVAMVMPTTSPLTLHARIAGMTRWRCAQAEFLPFAWASAIVIVASQFGTLIFLSGYGQSRPASLIALLLLNVAVGLLCPVLVLAVQRLLAVFRVPVVDSRWFAVLVTAALGGLGLYDALSWASNIGSASAGLGLLKGLSSLWSGDIPGDLSACLLFGAISIGLVIAGVTLSLADHAGGYLRPSAPLVRIPLFEKASALLVAAEIVAWIREPTARVSLICTLAADAALVWSVRSGGLDPGLGLVLIVLLSASGGELIVGRSLGYAWTLRMIGLGPVRILCLRTLPVATVMTVIVTATYVGAGLTAQGPAQFAEVVSLFLALFACASLAGALYPFDARAPLAMLGTSVVAFLIEASVLVVETAVFRLSGWSLVLADLVVLGLAAVLLGIVFRRAVRGSP